MQYAMSIMLFSNYCSFSVGVLDRYDDVDVYNDGIDVDWKKRILQQDKSAEM